MKHELLYQTQAEFTAAQGNSGNVTSITPGVAYVLETNSVVGYNKRWDTLLAEYQVDDVSSSTKIYNSASVKNKLKEIIVDKTHIPASAVTDTYQFTSPGLHIIRFRYSSLTAIPYDAFKNCGTLLCVKLPKTVTSIGHQAFANCSILTGFTHSTLCTYEYSFLEGSRKVKDVSIAIQGSMHNVFRGTGNPNNPGTLFVKGNWRDASGQGGYGDTNFERIIIDGNMTSIIGVYTKNVKILKVTGNCSAGSNSFSMIYPVVPAFVEVLGNVTSTQKMFRGGMVHFGYGEKISANPATIGISAVSKVYVGDGSSQEHDQQILDAYLADENWASYASKLDLWYNYNGQYKE